MRKSASYLLGLLIFATYALGQLDGDRLMAAGTKNDEQKSRQGNVTITTKEIAYTVTVENRTFKPIDQLQVKYMIFYLDPKPGSTDKPLELFYKGTETFTNFAANRTAT